MALLFNHYIITYLHFSSLGVFSLSLFQLHSCFLHQGKGLMNTYWLTCREGPTKKREEIAWFADIEPVFLKTLQTRTEAKTRARKYVKP